MAGWAEAFMTLKLRVDKTQAQRDVDSVDGTRGGRSAGQQFGQAFSREQLTRMNAGLAQFAAGSARASGQAGQASGRQFGDSFRRDAQGRWRDAFGAFVSDSTVAAMRAGQGSGNSYATGFRGIWERQKQAILSRFTADSGNAGGQAGQSAGRQFAAAFSGVVNRIMAGGGGGGGGGFLSRAGAQGGGRGAIGSLAAGIGPNILGLQVLSRAGLIGGGVTLGLGAAPALIAGAAPLGLAGLGAGAAAALGGQVLAPVSGLVQQQQKITQARAAAVTPAQQKAAQVQQQALSQQVAALDPASRSMFATISKLQDMWTKFTASFAPLFSQALAPIPRLFASILPALRQFFTGAVAMLQPLATGIADLARSALPLLGQAFRAAGPLLQPLLTGLGQLLSGVLPGLITLLKAAAPAATVLANFLGGLGRGLGGMLAQFAPVMQASSVLLGDLLGVVNALLPVIAQLAGIFARTLAPAFTAFAAVIQQLLPGLAVIGQVIGQLAAAMLTDLVAAFQAVAGLITAVSPALTAFARAISGIFTVLENTGVWAVLGNAVESVVGPLGQLISAVLRGLTPILPPLIGFIAQLSAILAAQLGRAVAAVLPPLTRFATQALALIARFLPPILPLITQLARQLGGALVAAVATLAPSLTQLATVALQTLSMILPVILPLITTFARVITGISARALTDLAIAINAVITAIPPRVLSGIVVGIVAIVGALKLWAVAQAVLDAELIANPIGLVIAAVAGLAIGITELVRHWNTVWGAITAAAAATGRFFTRLYRSQVVQDILAVWSLGLIPLAQHWNQVWDAIRNTGLAAWHGIYNGMLAPLISWFTVSLPHGLDTGLSHVRGWWRDVTAAFAAGWNTVWRNTITPMANLFTRDLPGWFSTAVTAAGRLWADLGNVIRRPVAWVVDNVLNGLINVFDWITSHIGLGRPIAAVHPFGLAAGGKVGKVLSGTGPTADDVIVRVSKDETVVSAADSNILAPLFGLLGIPGYQAGGRVGQNPPPGRGFAAAGTAVSIGGPALGPLGGIIHKLRDIGAITSALVTGNTTALANAFSDLLGHPGGATALLGQILTQIPRVLVRDAVNWIMGAGGGASGNAIADYAMRFLGRIPYVWGGTAVPGGADCCLPGDQPVLTSTGPKPIIDVQPGDWVITWEENRPAVRRVLRRSAARRQMTYLVVTATAELEASGNHPFLTVRPAGWAWTEVDDLQLGDLVVRYDEATGDFREEAVITVEPQAVKDTYDITVDGTHCFIAGGLVVHNSGFVQAIYQHFGIHAPRTSEQQGAWVHRSGPVPGSLAFYHSPPGGADPGHVAIVRSAGQVISQGGGMGPQLIPLHALPLLWTGVPPGGLGAAGGGGATGGTMSAGAIAALWRNLGGPAWAAANMARIAFAESGDRPSAVQQGQPPGLTGWGLYQITPTSGISQNGAFGNLLNAGNNTRAAISLFASSGYGPWTSDPVGRSLAAGPFGYARGGWINEPVTGVGRYSRALYRFAENRREYVTPEDQMPPGDGWGPVAARLDRIAALLDASPRRTAAGITAAASAPARLAAHAAWISSG